MGSFGYFFCTLGAAVVLLILVFMIHMLRKLYLMVDEADARLIQIRDMLEQIMGEKQQKPRKKAENAHSK